jgi:Outer membrane lipoprotein-sorting protein
MKILTAAIALMISVAGIGQETVTTILDKYFENIGGREAFRNLKGQEMTAVIEAQGMKIPTKVYVMADGKQLTRMEVMGMSLTQDAFDGETAWSTNFMTQKAEKSDAEQSENMKRAMGEYPSSLLDYEEKGFTVELMEDETVDGVDCYKLKVTKKPALMDGEEVENVEYFFMDKENFVPVQTKSTMHTGPGKGSVIITTYSDYQEVDGMYFPFSMSFKGEGDAEGQAIEFDTIVLNPVLEEGFFTFPVE